MMTTGSNKRLRISSIGTYLPERRLSNADLAEGVGFSEEFLLEKLGVLRRSAKEPGETNCDLCVKAFDNLVTRTNLNPNDIQLLVVVTQHPDLKVPYAAALVHNRLGLAKHCMTFDISQACAGYCHAVTTVVGLMNEAGFDHGVLITCDPYTDKVAPTDKDTALLFGDASCATYFTRSGNGYELIDSSFGTLPDSNECLMFHDVLEMDGQAVFRYATRNAPPSITRLLEENQLSVDDVDLFLLHQGSKFLVEYIARKMKVPEGKAPFEAADYGNTVSSSIPLILQKHVDSAELDTILLSAFGVGFSWGSNILKLREAEK